MFRIQHAQRTPRWSDRAPHKLERRMHNADVAGVAHQLANRKHPVEQCLRGGQILGLDAEFEELGALPRQHVRQTWTPTVRARREALQRDRLPAVEYRHLSLGKYADLGNPRQIAGTLLDSLDVLDFGQT